MPDGHGQGRGPRARGKEAGFRPGRIVPDFLIERLGSAPSTFLRTVLRAQHCGPVRTLAAVTRTFHGPGQGAQLLAVISSGADTMPEDPAVPRITDVGSITHAVLGVDRLGHAVAVALRPAPALAAELYEPTPVMIESVLAEMPAAGALTCACAAPVLMVPDVLSAARCHDLVAAHESDNFESGVLRERGGRFESLPDPAAKRRRDQRLHRDNVTPDARHRRST